MTRKWHVLVATGTALVVGACAEGITGSDDQPSYDLSAAFATLPAGYGNVGNSYVSSAAVGATPWLAQGGRDRGGLGTGELMGGGLGDAFVGGVGMGRGFGHQGPFAGALGCTGTFADGRVTCAPVTSNGLTIARSAAYADASGKVQQAFDSVTTNTANIRTEVSGTLAFTGDSSDCGFGFGPRGGRGGHGGRGDRHGGRGGLLLGDTATVTSATTTVSNRSDRTVTGLAQGSTQRTVNGVSASQESTTGTSSRGNFTSVRIAGDTTQGLVVPVQASGSYPTAGTVIRSMKVTVTYAGEAAVSQSRREVVTYDGSSTAKVAITTDGTTKSCTRPLPRGPLTCD